ncbi:ribosome recycling factor [Chloropicon primus]|uniref:Ribosome-recycling factor, chloroplastic n=1 Tax=Chloropicon primus TaxID=1764295 RepID=A0A5B8MCL6_9CHLO|nr:ribosome recycling factor [Chloropicon primus]UPQ97365.1 ribosome recycling factor [Chloropicon primus]|eukprot:QDZ18153.1 ribosome recycling factor [Chloropicon primus]
MALRVFAREVGRAMTSLSIPLRAVATASVPSVLPLSSAVSDHAPQGSSLVSPAWLGSKCHGLGLGGQSLRGYAAKKKSKKKDRGGPPVEEASREEEEADAGDEVDVFQVSELERDACFETLEGDFANIRPNRATPGMLDHLIVQAYDDKMPLKHLASSNVRDVSTLVVSVFDPQVTRNVEKAILDSPLGLNPVGEGQEIVVRVPAPTEESREQMRKIVRAQAEQAKVRLRKARQKAMQQVKKQMADKDERKAAEKDVEKFFDDALSTVQEMCSLKEKEVDGSDSDL